MFRALIGMLLAALAMVAWVLQWTLVAWVLFALALLMIFTAAAKTSPSRRGYAAGVPGRAANRRNAYRASRAGTGGTVGSDSVWYGSDSRYDRYEHDDRRCDAEGRGSDDNDRCSSDSGGDSAGDSGGDGGGGGD
jgi:hypothetical protein